MAISRSRPTVSPVQHFIDGEFVDSLSGETFESIDPATEEVNTTVARGRAEDVDRAAKAARRAFESGSWSRATTAQRRRVLMRAADLMDERIDEVAALDALEMGRPYRPVGSAGDSNRVTYNLRAFAMEQEVIGGEGHNRNDDLLTYTLHDPAGVYGLIIPWNVPVTPTWKTGPCLAYGNSAVLKPAEWAPLSIRVLTESLAEAGVPPGVFNVVHGYGDEAGAALVAHPDVVGISFTGSPQTARAIAAAAAPSFKRLAFELGGKSPAIVYDDADLERAVPTIAAGIFRNTGQICNASSRILVQRSVYDRFAEEFVAEARRWDVGDPFDSDARLGPLVSRQQYERVLEYLTIAAEEGEILVGGGRPAGLDRGFFVEPTVVADVSPTARVCQEEIFGPVATLIPFEDLDDAIEIANGTRYGLAAYIWTESQRRAHDTALRVRSAMIWINSMHDRDVRQPFGGIGSSGMGREGVGGRSRDFYTETRFVSFPMTPRI